MASRTLHRLKRREFRFPVSQDIGLGLRKPADFPDTEVEFVRNRQSGRRSPDSKASTRLALFQHRLDQVREVQGLEAILENPQPVVKPRYQKWCCLLGLGKLTGTKSRIGLSQAIYRLQSALCRGPVPQTAVPPLPAN